MKKNFLFSFLVLGSTSLISQVTVFRELMISFYGNEFFIGVLLAVWLFWVASGSFLTGRFNFKNRLNLFYILTFIFSGLLFGLEIILIRWLNNFGVVAGQMADLVPALLITLFLPAPLCFNLGAQFALAAKIFPAEKSNSQKVSQIYLWESLGFVIGGIFFNFWLVQINPFLVLALVALVNLTVALALAVFLAPRIFWLKFACLILIIGFLSFIFWTQKIDKKSLSWRFDGQTLLESVNSLYGHLAVTKIGTQYNFYESGLLLGSEKEVQNNEYLAHLTLLQHSAPKNVLLIGGGFNGLIGEILKHPVQKLTYLELDWRLLDLVKKYAPQEIKSALTDKKVKILNLDGRYFIKNSAEKFDVILINLPPPSTALFNRFYTQEFFKEATKRLNPEGILAIQLPFSPEYQSFELVQLNNSLFKTLNSIFSQVLILPEYSNLFLASQKEALTYNPEVLVSRFRERQIKTAFFTENYLTWRLTNERISLVLNSFNQDKNIFINQDFKPSGYFYNLTYWLTYFHPGLGPILTKISQLNFWWFLALLLSIIFLPYLLKKQGRTNLTLILNMAIFGCLIMAGEIIFILLYQTIFGYLYYKLALLMALLMAGLALGTWHGKKQIELKKITVLSVIKIQIALMIFVAFSLLFFNYSQPKNQFLAELIFYLIFIIFGYLAGFGFPYLNHLYLKNKKDSKANLSLLYSADLIGAALGAILPALILLPLFGFKQTLFLIIVIVSSGSLLLFFFKNLSSENV